MCADMASHVPDMAGYVRDVTRDMSGYAAPYPLIWPAIYTDMAGYIHEYGQPYPRISSAMSRTWRVMSRDITGHVRGYAAPYVRMWLAICDDMARDIRRYNFLPSEYAVFHGTFTLS
jgi:hypothetical protein